MRRLVLALLFTGCATTSPRFEQDVAHAFASQPMRHLVTEDLEVYYPAQDQAAAEKTAARAAECLRRYRSLQATPQHRERALLFLTDSNYNNAYVSGQAGGEPLHSLNPLFATSELFHLYGFSIADTGDISCHEMFHFAHYEQVENLWWAVNTLVGPVMPSQTFLERWFTEGIAQYYEGRITHTVGRPNSAFYRGAFEGFVAGREGQVNAGDLSVLERELYPFSGAYLTSLPFVEWLATKHGEAKLWELMDLQARAFFVPLGVTLRFRAVYGATLGELVDEWSDDLRRTLPARHRPGDQRVLRAELGQLARLATHPNGTMALVTAGNDEGPRLRLLGRDGTLKVERTLVQLTPDRDWVLAGPSSFSGLSFTADGKFLFLINDDLVTRGDTQAQLWKLDAQTGEVLKVWQRLGYAVGGAVRPDGTRYTTVEVSPGHAAIVDVELSTGAKTELLAMPDGVTAASLAWSPDGARLVWSELEAAGWNLRLREPDGAVRNLTTDGAFNYGARWVDPEHLIFTRAIGGRLQVHRLDVSKGQLEVLTDAPWAILDPGVVGDDVAFINREGSQWSLDLAPMKARTVLRTSWAETRVAQEEPQPDAAPSATDVTPSAPAAPPPSTPPLQVQSDEGYSSLDHLFVPQLRIPGVLFSLGRDDNGSLAVPVTLTGALAGRDRLGFHSWALNAAITFPGRDTSISAEYRNLTLAPWDIGVFAGRDGYVDEAFWSASVDVSRAFYTTPISLGFQAVVHDPYGFPLERYIGPNAAFSYGAGESTAYGGTQRLFAIDVSAAGYPRGFGSSRDVADLRASISLATPLPVLKRQSFVVTLTGRMLPGAPDGALRLGGVARGALYWVSPGNAPNETHAPRGPGVYLPGSLVESVRGFDDAAVRGTGAAVGHARYRYSFIIDRGFASTLYLFPSLFIRQLDVEGFGSAAVTNAGTWLRAVGGAVIGRLAFGGSLGVSVYGQAAWRFDAGLGPLYSMGLTFE